MVSKEDVIAIRTGLGISQSEFATSLGISEGYVGDIERGHRQVSIRVADALERLTGRDDLVAAVVNGRRNAA